MENIGKLFRCLLQITRKHQNTCPLRIQDIYILNLLVVYENKKQNSRLICDEPLRLKNIGLNWD